MNMTYPTAAQIEERFFARVTKGEDGCWLWQGATNAYGYGRMRVRGKDTFTHRWSYERFVSIIPAELQIDHLCRVHNCVNPDHLEAVTQRVNLLRGETVVARNASKTHCDEGHPLPNVPRGEDRRCRKCSIVKNRVRLGWDKPRAESEPVGVPFGQRTHCPQGHEFTEENTYHLENGRGCHICRVRSARRAIGWDEERVLNTPIGIGNAAKTHCKQGHAFTEDNIYRIGSTRVCATCRKAQQRAYNARKRAKSLAA